MAWRFRFHIATGLKVLAFLLSSGLFAFSVWYVWTACSVPVELEIREGTVWLYALAKRAGVDIYDSNRLAFVNMNHGPMDAILKGWIATLAPTLSGCTVTRSFVFLLPFFLLGSAFIVGRRSLTEALLAAAALHLFLVKLTPMMLVGRSDATALCGLDICAALAHALLVNRHREWSNRRYVVLQLLLGASSAVVLLTSWRIVPTLAMIYLVVLVKQLAESTSRRFRCLIYAIGLSLTGFALVWVPTFLVELHGNMRLYYQRFFGFFSQESGWGSFPGAKFRPFPAEIIGDREGLLLLLLGLTLVALFRLRRERAQLVAWLLLLPLGWLAYSYGFYRNQGGGGLQYFCPFFLSVWILVLHALRQKSKWRPLAQLIVAGLIAGLLSRQGLLDQRRQLADLRTEARTFLRDVASRTGGQFVFGEDAHLFKSEYHDEVVDTGDTVDAIAVTHYYGEDFTRSYLSYVNTLLSEPPPFVIAAMLDPGSLLGTTTPHLAGLLKRSYAPVLQGPANLIANGGGGIALYERKAQ
jgi:hypothetical protein